MRRLLFASIATLMMTAATTSDRDLLVSGNNAFAVDLFRREAAAVRGNLFFSPLSLSAAMALVDAGATGATAAEIEKALDQPFAGSRLASSWKAVLDDVNRHAPEVELLMANALWGAKDIVFKPEYLAIARRDFSARIESLDFKQDASGARKRINGWVAEATRQRIPEIVSPQTVDSSTRAVVTNAIYMKGKWQTPFPKARTNQNGTFHGPDGDSKAAMMSIADHFSFAHAGAVKLLEMPYIGGGLSMLVVLPDDPKGLKAVENQISVEALASWQSALRSALVGVTFPRFSTETSFDLAGELQKMGVRRAFENGAEFGRLAAEPLKISAVVHKARVDVAEEGTEAAAATAVVMPAGAARSATPPKWETFTADHPFLYFIRKGGTILFAGRVVKP